MVIHAFAVKQNKKVGWNLLFIHAQFSTNNNKSLIYKLFKYIKKAFIFNFLIEIF
jgi:hypothetical protein